MWGILTAIDLKNCDYKRIRSRESISEFVYDLIALIKMKPFGECQIVHFGEDERVSGYTMVQMIETSLISGHFVNATNDAYIDIFSCREYDIYKAAQFTKKYFRAERMRAHPVWRC